MKPLDPPKLLNVSLKTQIRKYQKYADEDPGRTPEVPF